MSNTTKMEQKELVKRWSQAGELLDELKLKEVSNSAFQPRLEIFNGLFEMAIVSSPPGNSSGLIEFQRLLKKAGCKS